MCSQIMQPKNYTVIKFKQLPINGIFEYQCVPSSWIKCRDDTDGQHQITVAYPSEVTASTEKHIRSGKDPLLKWPLFPAYSVKEIDSFTTWPRILSLIQEYNNSYNVWDMMTMLNQCDEDEQRENIFLKDIVPKKIPDKKNSGQSFSTIPRNSDYFNETERKQMDDESFVRESPRPTWSGQNIVPKRILDKRNSGQTFSTIPWNRDYFNDTERKKMDDESFVRESPRPSTSSGQDIKQTKKPDKRNSGQTFSTIPRNSDYFNETERKKMDDDSFVREPQRPSTSSGQGKSSLDRTVPNEKVNESIGESEDPGVCFVRWSSDSDRDEESHLRKKYRKLNESIGDSNRKKKTSGASDSDRDEESDRPKGNFSLNASIIKSSGPKHIYGAAHSCHDDEFHRDGNRKLTDSSGQKRTSETRLTQEDELQQIYSKKTKISLLDASNRIDTKVLNQFKESSGKIILFLEELLTKNDEG